MKSVLIALLVILGILGFIALSLMGLYNGLVGKRAEVQTQRAQVETQLQRRFDLVPNLVGAVKGAMKQEQAVFSAIADARTKYAGAPAGSKEKVEAANQYESALGRLLVIMENYPQLKSIDTVQDLMTQLEGTENRVSVARQRYNEAVQVYNVSIRTFPTNLLAGMFGFTEEPLFQAVEGAQTAPK